MQMKSTNLKLVKRMCKYIHETIETMAESDELTLAVELFDDIAFRLLTSLDADIEAAQKEEVMQSEF